MRTSGFFMLSGSDTIFIYIEKKFEKSLLKICIITIYHVIFASLKIDY